MTAFEKILKYVSHKPVSNIIKKILFSNNRIERRIDDMSYDIQSFLCKYLQKTYTSAQLDESISSGNEALLLAYVRFKMDQKIHKEEY